MGRSERAEASAVRTRIAWWTALPLALALPAAANAEVAAPARSEAKVEFSADEVTYDSAADLLTARGSVRMNRDGNYLAADSVTWDRKTGQVRAQGEVVLVTPEGDRLIGADVVLSDSLRDGTIENLLVVLDGGGRVEPLAAFARDRGRRSKMRSIRPAPSSARPAAPKNRAGRSPRRRSSTIRRAADFSSRAGGSRSSASPSRCCRSSISRAGRAGRPAGSSPTSASRPRKGSRSRSPITCRSGPTAI